MFLIFDISLCNLLTNLTIVVSVPIDSVSLDSMPTSISTISVISGASQTFTCSTKQPSARYQWYKGTTNITATGDRGVKLVTFDKADNGSELRCRGWNRVTKIPYPESAMAVNVLCMYNYNMIRPFIKPFHKFSKTTHVT